MQFPILIFVRIVRRSCVNILYDGGEQSFCRKKTILKKGGEHGGLRLKFQSGGIGSVRNKWIHENSELLFVALVITRNGEKNEKNFSLIPFDAHFCD